MKLVNTYGCTMEGEFTDAELERFKKTGWVVYDTAEAEK